MTGASQASEPEVAPNAMTGACFTPDSLILRACDLALLQRKPVLYLASFNQGMATAAYSVEDGRIAYRIVSGTIDAAMREEIDRALVRLQRKLA